MDSVLWSELVAGLRQFTENTARLSRTFSELEAWSVRQEASQWWRQHERVTR